MFTIWTQVFYQELYLEAISEEQSRWILWITERIEERNDQQQQKFCGPRNHRRCTQSFNFFKDDGFKRNSWHHDQNLAEIPAVNLAKKLSFSRKSWRDSRQDRAKSLGIFASWRESWRH